LIAVIGAIIPVVAYKIGKEFKYDFSIPAAVLFAFFPYYVIHSHYITPDTTITFFTLLIILFSIKYLKRGQDKHIYIAAVFAAINTAEKYPGLLSFGIVIIAVLIDEISQRSTAKKFEFRKFLQNLSVLTAIFLIALFISAPNLFIEYGKVIDAVIIEARSTHLGADNLGWVGNILFYLEMFVAESNPIILIFFFIGLFACTKLKKGAGILLVYGFAYWVIMSKLGLHWVRWALPMYTAPLLLASLGMAFALANLRKKKYFKYLLVLVIFTSVFEQAVTSLAYSSRMGFTDTRVAGLNFCNNIGITTENAIYEGYTPLEPQFFKTIFSQDFTASGNSVDYFILSSQMYSRYFAEPQRYAEEVNFYETIENDHQLIKEINPTESSTTLQGKIEDITYYVLRHFNKPQNERYYGPTIRIFKIIR